MPSHARELFPLFMRRACSCHISLDYCRTWHSFGTNRTLVSAGSRKDYGAATPRVGLCDSFFFSCQCFALFIRLLSDTFQFGALPCQCPAQGTLRRVVICTGCDFRRCRCTRLPSSTIIFPLGFRSQVVRRIIGNGLFK